MKEHRGVEVQLQLFLTSAADVEQDLPSRPGRFVPRKENRCLLNRRFDGPQSCSGRVEEKKISLSTRIRNPDRPAYSLVTTPTT